MIAWLRCTCYKDDKVKFYGENRRAVGGRSDGGDDGGDDDSQGETDLIQAEETPSFNIPVLSPGRGRPGRDKIAVEPVAWNTFPPVFYKEIASSMYANKVLDLTPGAGNFALYCLESGAYMCE